MKIYVVRHGITRSNKLNVFTGKNDEPLEPEGFEQARGAKEKLPADIGKIYCSSLIRAVQTAETINEKYQLDITKCPEIQEVDVGGATAKTFQDSPGLSMSDWRGMRYDFSSVGGERMVDVEIRVKKFLERVKTENRESDKILVVTHGGILRMLYYICKNTTLELVENASVHEFEV